MTYEILLDIMDELDGRLKGYRQMLSLDTQIINNRNSFKAVCKPEEIVKNYIEELQDIMDILTNSIQ